MAMTYKTVTVDVDVEIDIDEFEDQEMISTINRFQNKISWLLLVC